MEKEKKKARYGRIIAQLSDLLTRTKDPDARIATITAVLHHKFDKFFWTGFYFLKDGELVVRSYQGPVACQVLKKDTGVCWASINQQQKIIVPDVHQFPGHIACDSRSNSEIVIPVRDRDGTILGVLDVDSEKLNSFDEVDAENLEQIVGMIFS